MMQVPLDTVKKDLPQYLRIAEQEDVIITRHGVPAGILIGFKESEDWWEDALLQNPHFQERIAQARQNTRDGRRFSIESLRAELSIDPPLVTKTSK